MHKVDFYFYFLIFKLSINSSEFLIQDYILPKKHTNDEINKIAIPTLSSFNKWDFLLIISNFWKFNICIYTHTSTYLPQKEIWVRRT
jgi:hypothetical protein